MSTLGIAVDILGWSGAVILVAAYALISYGALGAQSPIYQTLNVVGSVLLVINTAWHHAWPSSVVNIVWVGIAIGALIRGWHYLRRGETTRRNIWSLFWTRNPKREVH